MVFLYPFICFSPNHAITVPISNEKKFEASWIVDDLRSFFSKWGGKCIRKTLSNSIIVRLKMTVQPKVFLPFQGHVGGTKKNLKTANLNYFMKAFVELYLFCLAIPKS